MEMSKETLEREKHEELVYGLQKLIITLELYEEEALIEDLQQMERYMSLVNCERGIEILVAILSRGRYTNTNIGETK
jgi:hypothetical protein